MNLYDEIDLEKIDLNSLPPEIEPARQYYFIAKCRQYVKVFEKENGRLPSACVFNMGCP